MDVKFEKLVLPLGGYLKRQNYISLKFLSNDTLRSKIGLAFKKLFKLGFGLIAKNQKAEKIWPKKANHVSRDSLFTRAHLGPLGIYIFVLILRKNTTTFFNLDRTF